MAKLAGSALVSWKTAAAATLLCIWLVWSVSFLRPQAADGVLSTLPGLGKGGGSSDSDSDSASANASEPQDNIDDDSLRPLVLYTYAESENARENFAFFIRNGLHGRADFVFIFNGETDAYTMLPDLPNIQIVQRENKCFDIGAHGEVLRQDDLWKKYKRFITMNASVRGPFAPTYFPSCWMDAFLGKITDKVKLVGTTLNCHPRIHLQSMLLATDDIGMSILLDPDLALSASVNDFYGTSLDPVGFTPCFSSLKKAVHAEIGITTLIKSQGYEVDVVMTAPHSHGSFEAFCEAAGKPDDFLYKDRYLGTNVHPYETVFMKANREIDPMLLQRLTEWHLDANMTSWDACGR
ncbi:hypothetical protein M406DRAFT_67219 [Cryphonectria parasitica EP155]|uniref:Uncharacterized protein n=1 Tax=Cryphonectria parasitica (strain ATCC 38755 / EP155) TaxID=660469 RepID=A0A9P5CV51_CRYP1|nr:uncharacterized protein M406DRAFT_67219 [Cryphonectria parasitica EP155]KAF3770856.1 hypothetical protein M406DRAFT_67219 [Cryphonectria parasitica EP155]